MKIILKLEIDAAVCGELPESPGEFLASSIRLDGAYFHRKSAAGDMEAQEDEPEAAIFLNSCVTTVELDESENNP